MVPVTAGPRGTRAQRQIYRRGRAPFVILSLCKRKRRRRISTVVLPFAGRWRSYRGFRRFSEPGPQPPKGAQWKGKIVDQRIFWKRCVNSRIAICSIECAFPAGRIVHRPSYYCSFTYLAVGVDVKSVSQLQTGYAASRPLWCRDGGPRQILEPGPHNRKLRHRLSVRQSAT